MSLLLETTLGDIVIDLDIEGSAELCQNILKLAKARYYTSTLIYNVQPGRFFQLGDPNGDGRGGACIYGLIASNTSGGDVLQSRQRFLKSSMGRPLTDEECRRKGQVVATEMNGIPDTIGSQLLITISEGPGNALDGFAFLDSQPANSTREKPKFRSIGVVAEDEDGILDKIAEAYCDADGRPYADIRIIRALVIDDPFDDPKGMAQLLQSRNVRFNEDNDQVIASPEYDRPTEEKLELRIQADQVDPLTGEEDIAQMRQREEEQLQREDKSRAVVLEMLGDLPSADIKAPENVLFVCKLNPVTEDEDLELIFSRFDEKVRAEIIRDHETGNSLQYAFVEFTTKERAAEAYFKMDNALVDDRRIKVDFSQSVAKVWNKYSQRMRNGPGGSKQQAMPKDPFAESNNQRGRQGTKRSHPSVGQSDNRTSRISHHNSTNGTRSSHRNDQRSRKEPEHPSGGRRPSRNDYGRNDPNHLNDRRSHHYENSRSGHDNYRRNEVNSGEKKEAQYDDEVDQFGRRRNWGTPKQQEGSRRDRSRDAPSQQSHRTSNDRHGGYHSRRRRRYDSEDEEESRNRNSSTDRRRSGYERRSRSWSRNRSRSSERRERQHRKRYKSRHDDERKLRRSDRDYYSDDGKDDDRDHSVRGSRKSSHRYRHGEDSRHHDRYRGSKSKDYSDDGSDHNDERKKDRGTSRKRSSSTGRDEKLEPTSQRVDYKRRRRDRSSDRNDKDDYYDGESKHDRRDTSKRSRKDRYHRDNNHNDRDRDRDSQNGDDRDYDDDRHQKRESEMKRSKSERKHRRGQHVDHDIDNDDDDHGVDEDRHRRRHAPHDEPYKGRYDSDDSRDNMSNDERRERKHSSKSRKSKSSRHEARKRKRRHKSDHR